ncbi:MAG: DUF4440 domain-containing protein [Sphingopyxis terrae]|uniref:DUF4440 domain-containing protein n=1 Tax=Sphingopyxis terrae TaxID=33052 RepID=UPI003F7E43E3
MSLSLFLAAALAPAPQAQPAPPPAAAAQPALMPTGTALDAAIAANDARLFWAVFEGCDPAALPDLLTPDYRMLHDKGGLAIADRADFVASMEKNCAARAPGGAQAGYRNRRLLVPGSRVIRALGDWGALEEAAHVFFEWNAKDARWDLVGGARYMHVWQWMPAEARFRLSESLSYDHGAAAPYPPPPAD